MSEAIVKKDERSEVSSLSEAIMTAHNDNRNIPINGLNHTSSAHTHMEYQENQQIGRVIRWYHIWYHITKTDQIT